MAEKTAAAAPAVSVGETVSGTVEHIAPYGAFVRLESGQKAMVHISELSHNYVKKVEDVLEQGQKVTAKVIKIDDKGRIDLSIKAMQVREVRPPARREEDFEKKLAYAKENTALPQSPDMKNQTFTPTFSAIGLLKSNPTGIVTEEIKVSTEKARPIFLGATVSCIYAVNGIV